MKTKNLVFRFVGYYLTAWYNERKEIEVEREFSANSRFIKNEQFVRSIHCDATIVSNGKKVEVFADIGTKLKRVVD